MEFEFNKDYEVIKYRIKQITNPDGNSTPTDILVPKGTEYTTYFFKNKKNRK